MAQGFIYQVTTSLSDSTQVTGEDGAQFLLKEAFELLSISDIFENQTFVAQTKFSSHSPDLVLDFRFNQAIAPSSSHVHLEFESIGLTFPLASPDMVLPMVILRGSITIGGNKINIEADFNVSTKYLSPTLTRFPSFGQFISQFSDFVMGDELAKFLPIDDFSGLGSITLEMVSIGINVSSPVNVDRIRFIIAAEKPLSLIGDIVQAQPSLIVQLDDPFHDYRQFEVDVYGRWLLEKAEIDTILAVTSEGYQITAQLALGQSLNISHLLSDIFGGQIEGVPNLSIYDFEFIGFKSDDTTLYEVTLGLDTGWHLGILPLTFDGLHLEVAFMNGELKEAEIIASLEFSQVLFTLSALYDPDNRGWTFSGGTVPSETIKVGQFLADLATELGTDPHNQFLDFLKEIEITGLHVEYSTYQEQSSRFALYLSLSDDGTFTSLPLNNILVSFQTSGSGVKWRFDAKSDGSGGVTALTNYIKHTHSVDVALPESLTSLSIQEIGGYYDSALGNYGFTLYLNFGDTAKVYVQIDLIKQLNNKLEKNVRGLLVFNEGTADELVFEIDLVSTAQSTDFVAVYQAQEAKALSLATLVNAITGNDDGPDFSIDIRNALFSYHKQGTVSKSIFAIDMDAGINLSGLGDLPLIGAELAQAETLTMAFQIVYATATYQPADLKALNGALSDDIALRFPETAAIAGCKPNVNVQVRLGSESSSGVNLPISLDQASGTLHTIYRWRAIMHGPRRRKTPVSSLKA